MKIKSKTLYLILNIVKNLLALIIIIAVFCLISPGTAEAAIAVDAVSTGPGTDATTITVSHTTSGTNRLMLVGITADLDVISVTSVTYNGVALDLGGSEFNGTWLTTWIYKLVAPATGTHDMVVTFAQAVSADEGHVGVITFTGVDQTTPLGTCVTRSAWSTPISVDVSSASGELVFDTFIAFEDPLTVGAGQTQRWNVVQGTTNRGASTEPGAATVTMSWTPEGGYAIVAVPIKPAPAAVYYSVGTSTADLKNASNISISSGTATFTAGQEDNVGVGDVIDYSDADWLTGWNYRKKITIQNTNIDSNLPDFPVYIDITADGDIGSHALSTGYDLRFTQSDGITLLKYEREYFNIAGSLATGHFWVKVPSLLASGTNEIYIYYGKSDATDGEDKTNVWDNNFEMIQHMDDAIVGSTIEGSTSNGITGTKGWYNNPAEEDGKIGMAQDFDGATEYMTFEDHSMWNWTPVDEDRTFSFWFYPTINLSNDQDVFQFLTGVSTFGNHYQFMAANDLGSVGFACVIWNNGWTRPPLGYYGVYWWPPSLNTWYYITFVASTAGNNKFYVDGDSLSLDLELSWDDNTRIYPSSIEVKSVAGNSVGEGRLDELRWSHSIRAAAWVKFEFNNMNEADNELTWGSEETLEKEAYISGRTSPTVFTVQTVTGGTPADVSDGTVNSIKRVFNTLSDAEDQSDDASYLNTSNLVTGNYQLNWVCYADGADTSAVTINGWTTSADNYIKIYTPVSASEVGTSQRHSGVWNTTSAYGLVARNATAIYVQENYVKIDGLQVYLQSVDADDQMGIYFRNITGTGEGTVSNCILRGKTTGWQWHAGVVFYEVGTLTLNVYNNIIYGFVGPDEASGGVVTDDVSSTAYVYNNTMFGCYNAIFNWDGTVVAKNNIAFNSTDDYYSLSAGSDCNLGQEANGGGTNYIQTFQTAAQMFVDPAGSDFHILATSDAYNAGTDLSADPNLAFSDDIDGEKHEGAWDIGADEYWGDWLSGWANRVKIGIDHTDITSALSNFPVLIYLSDSSGIYDDDVTFVFDELGSDSMKIAVTASDGITQRYVEIEKWDASGKEAWLWTKIPDISSSRDTDFYLYYDSTQTGNTEYVGGTEKGPAENVWDSSFKAVWHLDETTGGAGAIKDATSNNNDGTDGGSPTFGAVGKIGNAISFDGSDDYVNVGSSSSLDNIEVKTVSAWIKLADIDEANAIVAKGSEVAQIGWFLFYDSDPTRRHRLSFIQGWNEPAEWHTANGTVDPDTMYHVAVTYDRGSTANDPVLYIDGVSMAVTERFSPSGTIGDDGALDCYIAKYGVEALFGEGIIDEVRISNPARSAAWIKASYESGRDDLLDFGGEALYTMAEVINFSCSPGRGSVILRWNTTCEVDNVEWRIYRSTSKDKIGERIAVLKGPGNSSTPTSYEYVDKDIEFGTTYYYRIADVNSNGVETLHGPVQITPGKPFAFTLFQNYPNPYHSRTTIMYEIPKTTKVSLRVYDVTGALMRTLVDREQKPNRYKVVWDGNDNRGNKVSGGVYFYRLEANGKKMTKKMVLME